MRPSLEWLMIHLAGTDWKEMNVQFGDVLFNIPLCAFFTILFTGMLCAFFYMIRCFFLPSTWMNGYECGYADGIYTKACRLANLKFNHTDNVVVCEVNKKEVDQEKKEALKKY